MLEAELDKIHDFQKGKTSELARRIRVAEGSVERLVKEEEAYNAAMAEVGSSRAQAWQHAREESGAPANGNGNGNGNDVGKANYGSLTDLEDQRRHGHDHDGGSEDDLDDEDDSDDDALGDELSGKSADTFEEQFRWLEEEVAILVADVHDLALFSKLNLTGFMKILKVRYFLLVFLCQHI